MKSFNKKVRWEFKLAMHGYGENVREALRDALCRMSENLNDQSEGDLHSIENNEVVMIDESDIHTPVERELDEEECTHDDLDHGICLDCEEDLTDVLTDRAYDYVKGNEEGGY